MSNKILSEISKNYAKALIEISIEHDLVQVFSNELEQVVSILNSSDDLKVVISNSSISVEKKIDIIDEIFKNKIDSNLLKFLKILIQKNRFNEINSIYEAFIDMKNSLDNTKTVEIISAKELDFENKTMILLKLEKKLNCEIKPLWTINSEIIAGLVFKFDDYVIDTSLNAKLEDLSKKISN